jgi:hypothetical protein
MFRLHVRLWVVLNKQAIKQFILGDISGVDKFWTPYVNNVQVALHRLISQKYCSFSFTFETEVSLFRQII